MTSPQRHWMVMREMRSPSRWISTLTSRCECVAASWAGGCRGEETGEGETIGAKEEDVPAAEDESFDRRVEANGMNSPAMLFVILNAQENGHAAVPLVGAIRVGHWFGIGEA